MKPGNVIYYNPNHPSFNWNRGLFVILEVKDDGLKMCKLDSNSDGLQLFDDGRCMITVISENGPIELTKLQIDISNLKW